MMKCLGNADEPSTWITLLGTGLWYIWLARNEKKFTGTKQYPLSCVIKAKKMATTMQEIDDDSSSNNQKMMEINVKWDCPPRVPIAYESALMAETMALRVGIKVVKELNLTNVVMETDCSLLHQLVTNKASQWNYREVNHGADALANFVAQQAETMDWELTTEHIEQIPESWRQRMPKFAFVWNVTPPPFLGGWINHDMRDMCTTRLIPR
ncbi:hypothetical protein IFM89_015419 [Coptis chinensis]|uniref:RNase H type-1 domain-containing protein n=1 Tax=Coptis chinensis TaxID=261450 RepID=A0A835MA13_9MAGN|nr:hypothetical protein IFM89_015419 [Coptis chinensis]